MPETKDRQPVTASCEELCDVLAEAVEVRETRDDIPYEYGSEHGCRVVWGWEPVRQSVEVQIVGPALLDDDPIFFRVEAYGHEGMGHVDIKARPVRSEGPLVTFDLEID